MTVSGLARKTERAWAALDAEHQIALSLSAGDAVTLSASAIGRHREARLMTKFDTRAARPPLLAATTILPVTNGSYVLLAGDGYADIPELAEKKRWTIPATAAALTTLPWWQAVQSESQALDMALASGMLEDFLDERRLALTIRGRRVAPSFAFTFDGTYRSHTIEVRGVQIEVDAGLEGRHIHLIEAKLGKRTNFHVRQIYYPLRMWQTVVPAKPVTTTLLTWHDRVFSLRRFVFEPEDRYHAIKLDGAADYVFDEDPGLPLLADVLAETNIEPAPPVPFPQADDFQKVIDLVDAVAAGIQALSEIAARYAIVQRQAEYYRNAARFLDLIETSSQRLALSEHGRRFKAGTRADRHRLMLERMASRAAFREALVWMDARGAVPSVADATPWVAEAAPQLTGLTPARRAATVVSWARWAFGATARNFREN